MKKLLASLRTMLLLPLLALGVAPASAQTSLEPVPALADIKVAGGVGEGGGGARCGAV